MVKIGHLESAPESGEIENGVTRILYDPPHHYELDIEIIPAHELMERASSAFLKTPKRLQFYLLICVTEGHCTHIIDFEAIKCAPGSLLLLRPGQVQRYDASGDWNGWLIMFRPEFLQSTNAPTLVSDLQIFRQLEMLPEHFELNENEHESVVESISRMFRDTKLDASTATLHSLLRSQLHAVLIRLYLIQMRLERNEDTTPVMLQRFKDYRLKVEQEFHHLHQVADYANLLGCSEKSLNRATRDVVGVNAKTFLSQRIALEAKRLLTHTGMRISAIADSLGFDEATNFVKFFRREVGCLPGEFRKQHLARE